MKRIKRRLNNEDICVDKSDYGIILLDVEDKGNEDVAFKYNEMFVILKFSRYMIKERYKDHIKCLRCSCLARRQKRIKKLVEVGTKN